MNAGYQYTLPTWDELPIIAVSIIRSRKYKVVSRERAKKGKNHTGVPFTILGKYKHMERGWMYVIDNPSFETEQKGPNPPGQYQNYSSPYQRNTVAIQKKWTPSPVIALLLTLFFGPFGLFYVGWKEAAAMFVIWMVIMLVTVLTLGVGLILVPFAWVGECVWGYCSAASQQE